MRNRTMGINVRVTPAEKHRMESAARRCGLTLSEYLRQRALGYTPQFHPPASLFSALRELDALADRLPPGDAHSCRTATDQIRDALLPKE